MSHRARERQGQEWTHPVVIGSADTGQLALVDAIDIQLLEDCVGRGGADKESRGSEDEQLRHNVKSRTDSRETNPNERRPVPPYILVVLVRKPDGFTSLPSGT